MRRAGGVCGDGSPYDQLLVQTKGHKNRFERVKEQFLRRRERVSSPKIETLGSR